jgi:hypothetical protein
VKNKALLANVGVLMVKNAGNELLQHLSSKMPFLGTVCVVAIPSAQRVPKEICG